MAKGSVRKKGKKWYYRFYVEDESGKQVQKEYVGTESKSETEAMLRKAMEDYEEKKFVAKSENATLGKLLDMWVEEELKPGNLSNGTVMSYQGVVNRIKQHPIGERKLKTVTADHLQAYMDLLSFGGTNPDGTTAKALSKGYLRLFSAVLQGAFRFAVFPKRLITFNPMQYVVMRGKKEEYDLFSDEDSDTVSKPTLDYEQYCKLEEFLKAKDNPALLPIQIAYYTGLRIGEVCALTWQDINLDEQYTDGVEGEEIFVDQVYDGLLSGTPTPAFDGTPVREGFTFQGWKPDVAETVTATVLYTAQWEKAVVDESSGSESSDEASSDESLPDESDGVSVDVSSADASSGHAADASSGVSDAPQTGDAGSLALWLVLAGSAGAGVWIYGRRRKL